jgi:periplasmic divalent cation tolerance protein
MAEKVLLVISTFPDLATAQQIARKLIEEKCAACANILPAVESIYRWQEKVEDAPETLVLFKTTENGYERFQTSLRQLHPYEVPEIIAVPVALGLQDYLHWVRDNCVGG